MSDQVKTKPKRGLGRGLDALLPQSTPSPTPTATTTTTTNTTPIAVTASQTMQTYREISTDTIVPGRLQPRTVFDEDEITNLASSITEHGILQPLVVSPLGEGRFELIAGERRLRASQKAGLTKVPVVIKDVDTESMLLMSIVENIQRQDLNAIEEARAYETLAEQFSYKQEDIAQKLGKSRSTVANSLRLLELPLDYQEDLVMGKYTAGHARALLTVTNPTEREVLRRKFLTGISVREAEDIARKQEKKSSGMTKTVNTDPLTDELRTTLGTKILIRRNTKGKGKITIDFYSDEELNRITNIILGRGNYGVFEEKGFGGSN